jgi:ribonucleoside-diphosphate reductase alpha chain
MATLRDAAMLQQAGCGVGFPFHLLRPAGAITKTSGGTSSGPISFLRVYNAAFGTIKQQNRHGMMILSFPFVRVLTHRKKERICLF